MGLPTGVGQDDIAGIERRIARTHDTSDRSPFHHAADVDGLGIGFGIIHASPHVEIKGEIEDFKKKLAL